MSQELVTTQQQGNTPAVFGQRSLAAGVNAGAVAIEQERAIAEAQGQLILAKKFPRSMTAAITEFMEACASTDFAATAFYSVPNRGSGPSIRLAEEAARCYGNFVYGHRELSRSEGKSEIEVYAWDMEKNNRSTRQITVNHVTDTKNGPKKLTDQTDIDNKIANVASKQMRGRILALMPKHMIAMGVAKCKLTIAGQSDKPMSERLAAMAQAFGKYGVTNDHLVKYLGHPVDNTTIDEFTDLTGIFNALKEGGKASEYFGQAEKEIENGTTGAALVAAATKGNAARTASASPAAAPAPVPAADEAQASTAQTAKAASSKTVQKESKPVKESAAPAAAPSEQPAQEQSEGPDEQRADDGDVF